MQYFLFPILPFSNPSMPAVEIFLRFNFHPMYDLFLKPTNEYVYFLQSSTEFFAL